MVSVWPPGPSSSVPVGRDGIIRLKPSLCRARLTGSLTKTGLGLFVKPIRL
ncbi:hypothetical protein YC2023_077126 [Brassica napus]